MVSNQYVIQSTQIRLDDLEFSFFSMIAQLGRVQDVTVSEYRVELMFPPDDLIKEYYKNSKPERSGDKVGVQRRRPAG